MKGRQLKKKVLSILAACQGGSGFCGLLELPPRQVINPLFSFLMHSDPLVRWRAVMAMGVVVSRLGDSQMESARVIMRRFMWQLNDESGGIGWGCPEAMGEIMASHEPLAKEYSHILLSYIQPDKNFIEHPILQQGVLWGVGRLLHARAEYADGVITCLKPYLETSEAQLRGLAAWCAAALPKCEALQTPLQRLTQDRRQVSIYLHPRLVSFPIADLATGALQNKPITIQKN